MTTKRHIKEFVKAPAHMLYHVVLIIVSAGFALSLPYTSDFLARKFLAYWTRMGSEEMFLVSVEIALAVFLIILFNYIGLSLRDHRFARMAKEAGLVSASSAKGFFAGRRMRKFKESHGIQRDIMVLGSTGFRTFADPSGDLHTVLRNCREARIMLLNPLGDGASIRARSILDPGITIGHFREQIGRSIAFLKELRAVQKNVRLKLYNEAPLFKMAISGEFIWLKHYHAGLDVRLLPEFVFMHNQNPASLYMPFHQYFLKLWNNPGIPEYDLERDELVYRDSAGNEERRQPFPASGIS